MSWIGLSGFIASVFQIVKLCCNRFVFIDLQWTEPFLFTKSSLPFKYGALIIISRIFDFYQGFEALNNHLPAGAH